MRYLKALWVMLVFFFMLLFVMQNHDVLAQKITLTLNLYYVYSWNSIELPYSFLLLGAFVLGMLFAITFFLLSRIRVGVDSVRKTRIIKSQQREIEMLRAQQAKEVAANEKKLEALEPGTGADSEPAKA